VDAVASHDARRLTARSLSGNGMMTPSPSERHQRLPRAKAIRCQRRNERFSSFSRFRRFEQSSRSPYRLSCDCRHVYLTTRVQRTRLAISLSLLCGRFCCRRSFRRRNDERTMQIDSDVAQRALQCDGISTRADDERPRTKRARAGDRAPENRDAAHSLAIHSSRLEISRSKSGQRARHELAAEQKQRASFTAKQFARLRARLI
jgi:hypothetical protein